MVETSAEAAGHNTFVIGGELPVNRFGYSTSRLTGRGTWGNPPRPDEAVKLLRRAVELGVNFFDTAAGYGPGVAERLIRRALSPYQSDLVIATKAGMLRPGPTVWVRDGRPGALRSDVESSLANLNVERLDLLQLHRVDPKVPLADQVGTLKELQREGKVRFIGLSDVTVGQLQDALQIANVATVRNRFSLADRSGWRVLDFASQRNMGFIAKSPLASGVLADQRTALARAGRIHGLPPAQLALAWALRRSPAVIPTPAPTTIEHLEQNAGAITVRLTDDELRALHATVL
ncbi:aldo/keto reductase [Dactylosporangium darangshiense]|uniref:Aldo/keto reductase n=1 Tax=Dactylosporangium darangshiense TaxID=579108 RepID=A0ABP8DW37_9ACTN